MIQVSRLSPIERVLESHLCESIEVFFQIGDWKRELRRFRNEKVTRSCRCVTSRRSTKLGELLHRGAPLKQGAAARRAKPRAMVELEYERDEDEDASRCELRRLRLARTVSPVGVGGYRVDGEDVTREQYEEQLRSIGVLVSRQASVSSPIRI